MFERTFFITTVTSSRKPLFRSLRLADPFIQTMSEYAYWSTHPEFELDPPTAAKAGALEVPETHG